MDTHQGIYSPWWEYLLNKFLSKGWQLRALLRIPHRFGGTFRVTASSNLPEPGCQNMPKRVTGVRRRSSRSPVSLAGQYGKKNLSSTSTMTKRSAASTIQPQTPKKSRKRCRGTCTTTISNVCQTIPLGTVCLCSGFQCGAILGIAWHFWIQAQFGRADVSKCGMRM